MMIDVAQARQLILTHGQPLPTEMCTLRAANGRVNAHTIQARLNQPPFRASAMDGYAVRSADACQGAQLKLIGEAPAGQLHQPVINRGQALRVFTGSALSESAEHIVIQEQVNATPTHITITTPQNPPCHIRAAGIDFKTHDQLITAGQRLKPVDLALLAANNITQLELIKRPKIVLLASGNELKAPGQSLQAGQVYSSTPYALTPLIESWGGTILHSELLPDQVSILAHAIEQAQTADIIVSIGGASVGDYDLLRPAFKQAGYKMIFEKVAVKPGKPTWFAKKTNRLALGLPGNPTSSLISAHLFLKPLIAHIGGQKISLPDFQYALLGETLPANGSRETYIRARLAITRHAQLEITPLPRQDSSLLTPLVDANALICRPPHAEATQSGAVVPILLLDRPWHADTFPR